MRKEKLVVSSNLQREPLKQGKPHGKKLISLQFVCKVIARLYLHSDQTSLHFLELDTSQHFPSKQGFQLEVNWKFEVSS